ncbi:transcriptional regulator, AsnC family [Rhizobiales bacterium GAS188]|nr:transcriptional regulator, AsnC family [Rhizobiales bacterium GAS188]
MKHGVKACHLKNFVLQFFSQEKFSLAIYSKEKDSPVRERLDPTDRRLVKLLCEDAQLGHSRLAEKMAVSAPTVRSRLRGLVDRKLIKIVGLLNLAVRPELISAIVGINTLGRGRIHEIAQRIADLPFVTSASVVTGRFDIIAEVVVADDVADLYRVTSELIPRVGEPGEIARSETFVVMASCNKWVGLPKGCWSDEPDTQLRRSAPS